MVLLSQSESDISYCSERYIHTLVLRYSCNYEIIIIIKKGTMSRATMKRWQMIWGRSMCSIIDCGNFG